MTDQEIKERRNRQTAVYKWLAANGQFLPVSEQLYISAAYEQLFETLEPIYNKYHRGKAEAEKKIADNVAPVAFSMAFMKEIMKMREEADNEQQTEEAEENDGQ